MNCTHCGKEFEQRRPNHIRCSYKCVSSETKDRQKELTKEWLSGNSHLPKYYRIKARAKKKGVPFSLTKEQISELLTYTSCYYCKREINLEFDRSIPEEGYTYENIRMSCKTCNMIKGHSLTEDQMLRIAAILNE